MYGVGGFLGFVSWISSATIRPLRRLLSFLRRAISHAFLSLSCGSMAGGARGHGGSGGSPPRKLARHNAEAGSSSRSVVEPWRSKQARKRGRLSRSGGRSAWAGFNELYEVLSPHTKRFQEADAELLPAEHTAAVGEEGTANRLVAAKEDHAYATLAASWRRSSTSASMIEPATQSFEYLNLKEGRLEQSKG